MVRVFKINNPYNAQDGLEQSEFKPGVSLGEVGADYVDKPWLCVAYLEGKRFFPTRDEWNEITLKKGDCIYFMPHVGDPVTLIVLAVVAVAAVVLSLSIQPPSVADTPEPDPVFDLKGQKNQIRLGSPIEDGYGRVRLWPSYATRAYNQYYGNDQFQFQLFCLGHGSWDIETIQIEDTPIDQFQEVEVAVYQPGEQVTLFPDNVETSIEVGQVELYGPNEDEHQGHTGPFVANAVNTLTTHLEVDVILPRGLYFSNDSGGLSDVTAEALFEYRQIDEDGNPVVENLATETTYRRTIIETREREKRFTFSDWVTESNVFEEFTHTFDHEHVVVDEPDIFNRVTTIYYVYSGNGWSILSVFSKTLNTNTPQRFTLQKDVPQGRYEVRAIRINDANTSHRAGDTIEWVGLRAFLPSTRNFGDVTMLAIRARASNNLNDKASNRVNVYATRKLPNYDPATGTLAAVDDPASRTASRSPIWAMVNVLRAPYGGALDDRFLDLEFFAAEATIAENNGIFFDWIYDQKSTVWEAVKLPCFANRAIPMLNGSRVSFVRDKPQTLPTFFINPENTVSGSFRLEKKLFDLAENDGLEVEYTEPATWKPEVVLCLLPGQVGNNPKRIKLQGVTDRQRAFDLGMYLWYKESRERDQVTVKTGMEGYIPTYGDLGRFGSDIPRWGQNGFVESITGNVVTLSENVVFTDGEVHQMAIRGKTGQDLGPFTVTPGDAPNQVLVTGTIPNDQVFFDFQNEPPYFTFGVSNLVGKICRVVNLNPQEAEGVTIKAIVDDQGRHADFGAAPALNTPSTPPIIPDAPVVPSITVEAVPGSTSIVTVSWEPALGAVNYILQKSNNGTDWVDVDTVNQTNYSLPVVAGTLYVRVAGVNVGIGPFVSWTGEVGAPTGPPNDVTGLVVQPAFTGVSAHIRWQQTSQATSYVVRVFTAGILRCTHEVTATDYDFTLDEAIECGGLNRTITFEVRGKNSIGESANPASITVNNPVPAALTALSSTLKSDDGTTRVYTLNWNIAPGTDISFYRVWGSETQGFTPGAGNVLFEGLATGADVSVSDTGSGFPPLYWRVAAVDVWGDDTNPSAEQTI